MNFAKIKMIKESLETSTKIYPGDTDSYDAGFIDGINSLFSHISEYSLIEEEKEAENV